MTEERWLYAGLAAAAALLMIPPIGRVVALTIGFAFAFVVPMGWILGLVFAARMPPGPRRIAMAVLLFGLALLAHPFDFARGVRIILPIE